MRLLYLFFGYIFAATAMKEGKLNVDRYGANLIVTPVFFAMNIIGYLWLTSYFHDGLMLFLKRYGEISKYILIFSLPFLNSIFFFRAAARKEIEEQYRLLPEHRQVRFKFASILLPFSLFLCFVFSIYLHYLYAPA